GRGCLWPPRLSPGRSTMNVDPLNLLLNDTSGDEVAAVEQVIADYEPYLRMLVRRSLPGPLRSKFDSIDVVQSVWIHVLRAVRAGTLPITDRAHLQALLVTVARRRLVSCYRHHRAALECEEGGGADVDVLPASCQPRPSEMVQADDLWEKMLA